MSREWIYIALLIVFSLIIVIEIVLLNKGKKQRALRTESSKESGRKQAELYKSYIKERGL